MRRRASVERLAGVDAAALVHIDNREVRRGHGAALGHQRSAEQHRRRALIATLGRDPREVGEGAVVAARVRDGEDPRLAVAAPGLPREAAE
jgi:hypothetical protein